MKAGCAMLTMSSMPKAIERADRDGGIEGRRAAGPDTTGIAEQVEGDIHPYRGPSRLRGPLLWRTGGRLASGRGGSPGRGAPIAGGCPACTVALPCLTGLFLP